MVLRTTYTYYIPNLRSMCIRHLLLPRLNDDNFAYDMQILQKRLTRIIV